MGRCASPTRLTVDQLDTLLERVDEAFPPGAAPHAVGFASDNRGVDICLKPLPAPDPVGSLVGFVAPTSFRAFGLVSEGTSRPLPASWNHANSMLVADDPANDNQRSTSSEATIPPGSRVRMAHLVTRGGASVSRMRVLTGQQAGYECTTRDSVGGRVDDLCRRALAVATPDPAVGVAAMWANDWLERMVIDLDSQPMVTWAEVCLLHAACAPLAGQPGAARQARDRFEELTTSLYEMFSWDDVRLRCTLMSPELGDEAPGLPLMPPSDAAWHDAGSFSREVLATTLPAEALMGVLADELPPQVATRIRGHLTTWGVLVG